MATIKDVAKKAGVSIGVVSRAFNNYPDISEKTKQRIFEVARELNYTPNLAARNLSLKKQFTIGLISSGILDSDEKDSNNSFEVFKGVYLGTQQKNYELAIYLIDSQKQRRKSYKQFCRERNIGGAILQGITTNDKYFKELVEANIPCVLIDMTTDKDYQPLGFVSTDNIRASREMAELLIKNGHRKIACMAGKKDTLVNKWRMEGLKQALAENGLELSDEDLLYGDFLEGTAYETAKEYLEKGNRPTAFFCFSDLMAFGVMKAIAEAGLSIPEDISITGFDGLPIGAYTQPPLTTIKQNFFEMGRQAALLLTDIMEGKECDRHVYVDYQLLERKSVKNLIH